jgi:hypothetical protein
MKAATCALARVIYCVICDLRQCVVVDVKCSKRQFNFCLLFVWLSNTTPRLSRQPGVTGAHVMCEISKWLHVEIFQGSSSWNLADRTVI